MRRLMVLAAVALALPAVAIASAGHSTAGAPKLPAVVTIRGVAGVVPDMTPRQVRQQWNMRLPIIVYSTGSADVGLAPICAGRQQGVAIFVIGFLSELRFFRGTVTDRGVGIGSTVAELRRAYGKRLSALDGSRLYSVSGATKPRTTIQFSVSRGRVFQLSFGSYRGVGTHALEVYGLRC